MFISSNELYVVLKKDEISTILYSSRKIMDKIFFDYDLAIDQANLLNRDQVNKEEIYNQEYDRFKVYNLQEVLELSSDEATNDANQDGYSSGLEEGREAGYHQGHEAGYHQGHEDGYNVGYEEGNSAGFIQGHDEGFLAGYENGQKDYQ